MAAGNGRYLRILKNAVAIAGVRSKTVAINGSPVDVTGDDDDAYRTLLSEHATKSVDLTVEGVTKDDVLLQAITVATPGAQLLSDIEVEYPDGATLAGDFFLATYEEVGAHDDAVVFTATLQSSGPFTYTPAV